MIRHNGKKTEFWFLTVSAVVLCVVLFLFPNYVPFGKGDDNMFTVSLNGEEVGVTASEEEARECFRMARREIAQTSDIWKSQESMSTGGRRTAGAILWIR